jgi:nucleoside-diphosphate-sugar epimerase
MPNKVLVTGASGLLGVAAIEKFLSAGWDVVGVSRRRPKLPSGRDIEFLSVDLRDEEAARAAFEPLTDITHIAYTALHEKPELVAGWSSKEQIETNNAMLRNNYRPQAPAARRKVDAAPDRCKSRIAEIIASALPAAAQR